MTRDDLQGLVDAAWIFDTFTGRRAGAPRRRLEELFEVVALPGELFDGELREGDLVIRRALGEGGVAGLRVIGSEERWDAARLPFDQIVLRPLSERELIHPAIDVDAQRSLRRMSLADEASSRDANGMFAAVKTGELAGIYAADQKVPALRAKRMGIGWWQLIPEGEDSALVLEQGQPTKPLPRGELAPLIAFRPSIRSQPPRLDAALRKAWRSFEKLRAGQAGVCDLGALTTSASEALPVRLLASMPPLCELPSRPPVPECGPDTEVDAAILEAFAKTRKLAGEKLPGPSPLCAKTKLCPEVYHPFHDKGYASHLVKLDADTLKTAELAGLYGVDLAATKKSTAGKASHSVRTFNRPVPFQDLSFVALKGASNEVHVHKGDERIVESRVDGKVWKSLPHELEPPAGYVLFKRNWPEASLHRQWGREEAVRWLVGLANFYRDRTGVRMGIGDVSHVVGGPMTDHASHQLGRDADLYVLGYESYPGDHIEAYWCQGTRPDRFTLHALTPPSAKNKQYTTTGMTRLDAADEARTFERYATILAYCVATWSLLKAFVWHGVRKIEDDAVRIARNAFDSGWKDSWGEGPKSRDDIAPEEEWKKRGGKLIGQGSADYGAGKSWPPHQDHVHVRLDL